MVTTSDPNYQKLLLRLGPPIPGGGGELRYNSPFTAQFRKHAGQPDKRHHLYVNFSAKKFICYKSGVAGSISYLFMLLGEVFDENLPAVVEWANFKDRIERATEVWEPPRAELPEWYAPVVWGGPVHKYLQGRGVTDDDVNYYKIGQGVGDYTGWAIVPSFDADGKCEYWVSRRIKKGWGPKYRNPGSARRYHVGFLHNALQYTNVVIVCEGVFSALSAGRDAVVTFGKYVADTQLAKMWKAGVTGVILALDGDAWVEVLDTARRCYRMGFDTWVLPMPLEYDPSDMGRAAFREYLGKWCFPVRNELDLLGLRMQRSSQ